MEFLPILLILSFTSEIIDGYTNCTSQPVKEGSNDCDEQHICTVKEDTPVQLICGACPQGIETHWFKWDDKKQRYEEISTSKWPVFFNKVTVDMTDCYKCSCLYDHCENRSGFIDLQVHPVQVGEPRCIATGCAQNGNNTYTLTKKYAELKTHHKGRVCIDATCTGNGTLHYKWFRKNSKGNFDPIDSAEFVDSACDSGVHINSPPNGSHLCILPTIHTLCTKGDSIQRYMVNVSNDFGSIEVYATVEFPNMTSGGCSWFMRLHEKQSYGNVRIDTNGTGTAHCAVYHEDLDINMKFYLCKIESSKKGLSACYFQDLKTKNQCKQCDHHDTSEGFDTITFKSETVSNRLGMHSRGCVVRSPKPEKGQMYSCIAKREMGADSVSSSLQGQEWSDPQEIGTFQFVDPVLLTKKEIEEIFIPTISLSLCLLAVIAIAGFTFHKYWKKKKAYWKLEREIRGVQPRPNGVMEPGGGGDVGDSPESSLSDSPSATTESSFLLSSREHLRNYKSADSEAATKRSEPIPIEASSSSSVESFTGSITDSRTKSKVAEIDLEGCPSSTPSSKNSTVVSLPPGKQYDFTLGPNGKKISIYTDFVRQSPPQNILDGAVPLPDHIEEIVPISMPALLDFVDSMASCWDRIGIKLGLEDKVAELRRREAFPSSHLIMLLEIWLQSGRGVSWARLVDVLENPAVNMGTVAANIKDYLIKQVPKIPDNIDFLVPMSVPNLMHLVASFAQHWETIGRLLKMEKEVEKLKKAPYTNYVKMTLLLESWACLGEEFSWLNFLEECEGRHELRPLVADIRQHLLKKMRELYKPTSADKD